MSDETVTGTDEFSATPVPASDPNVAPEDVANAQAQQEAWSDPAGTVAAQPEEAAAGGPLAEAPTLDTDKPVNADDSASDAVRPDDEPTATPEQEQIIHDAESADSRVQEDDAPPQPAGHGVNMEEDGSFRGPFGEDLYDNSRPYSADNPVRNQMV